MTVTDPAQKPLADRAVGELAYMLARVGRMSELDALLQSVEHRTFCGPATEKIAGARAGLAEMRTRPEVSFRCGPLALHRIMLAVHPDDPRTELIAASESTQRGFSLNQLEELSGRLGLHYRMAFREPGADLVRAVGRAFQRGPFRGRDPPRRRPLPARGSHLQERCLGHPGGARRRSQRILPGPAGRAA